MGVLNRTQQVPIYKERHSSTQAIIHTLEIFYDCRALAIANHGNHVQEEFLVSFNSRKQVFVVFFSLKFFLRLATGVDIRDIEGACGGWGLVSGN